MCQNSDLNLVSLKIINVWYPAERKEADEELKTGRWHNFVETNQAAAGRDAAAVLLINLKT